jgi:hypothetical protein
MTTGFDLSIDAATHSLVLRAAPLGFESSWDMTRELIGRLLSSLAVTSVEVDRSKAMAILHLPAAQWPLDMHAVSPSPLRAIADGMRQPAAVNHLLSDVYATCPRMVLRKTARRVTAGSIVSQTRGRVRIRHPLLRRNADLVWQVRSLLAMMRGIDAVSASARTGSLLIRFQDRLITPEKLLSAIEEIIDEWDAAASSLKNPPVISWIAAGTCLGLAVATLVQPALAPFAAGALICSNLPTLGRGVVELCTFRWKVASLYTVIMGTTLASGQFLAAALMQASVTGWHAWTNHRLRGVVRDLTLLSHVGVANEIGQVRCEVGELKSRTSLIQKTVHSAICEAIGNGAATPRGAAVASKFVPYTFATGAAALMVGDLTTLAAVLRPDFSTGSSLSDRLGTLSSVSHLLHEGWLVRSGSALHKLASINTIVVTNCSMVSAGSDPEIEIERLSGVSRRITLHTIDGSAADCISHVRALRETKKHVAVLGDHDILRQLSNTDVVRISLTPEDTRGIEHADLIALHSEPQRLGDLLRVLHETRQPAILGWTAILACNALAVSGAFLIGLTNLHVIALTNAGIFAAGVLHRRQFRRSREILSSHTLREWGSSPSRWNSRPLNNRLLPDEENESMLEPANCCSESCELNTPGGTDRVPSRNSGLITLNVESEIPSTGLTLEVSGTFHEH